MEHSNLASQNDGTFVQDGCCTCAAAKKMIEVLKLNHYWKHSYNALLDKYKHQKEIERKYHDLKRRYSETKDMLRSFEEAAYIYSMADFEVLKENLLSYKNSLEKATEEKQKLMEHNRHLENELENVASKLDIFAAENDSMKEDLGQIWQERRNLLHEVQRLIRTSSVNNDEPIISVCEDVLEKSFIQNISFTDVTDKLSFQNSKNCRIEEETNNEKNRISSSTKQELYST